MHLVRNAAHLYLQSAPKEVWPCARGHVLRISAGVAYDTRTAPIHTIKLTDLHYSTRGARPSLNHCSVWNPRHANSLADALLCPIDCLLGYNSGPSRQSVQLVGRAATFRDCKAIQPVYHRLVFDRLAGVTVCYRCLWATSPRPSLMPWKSRSLATEEPVAVASIRGV